MSKVTSVRIKQDSGQYSNEIPIGTLASNTTYDANNNLLEVLGSNIDPALNGTVKEQLDRLASQLSNLTYAGIQSTLEDCFNDKFPLSSENLSPAWQGGSISPISSGTMIDLLDCAESYFNEAYTDYGEDAVIQYDSGYGLYSPELSSSNSYKGIVCSSFVDAILNGISYDNSRYKKGSDSQNVRYPWGYQFDKTGEFGRSSTADAEATAKEFEIKQRYLTSGKLAKYAVEHGYAYMLNNNLENVQPGDVIFSRNNSDYPIDLNLTAPSQDAYYPTPQESGNLINSGSHDYAYLGIDHCAIILTAYPYYYAAEGQSEGKWYTKVVAIQSWPAKKFDETGKDIGLNLYQDNIGTKSSGYFLAARFPLGKTNSIPTLINKEINISGQTDDSVIIKTINNLKQGFYTLNIKGSSDTTTSPPYVDLIYSNSNGHAYPQTYSAGAPRKHLFSYGDTFSIVFYMEKDGSIIINFPAGNSYSFDEISLYKGYAPPTYSDNTLNEVFGGNMTPIVENTNLNNLKAPGVYYSQNADISQTLTNSPFTSSAFRLEIKQINKKADRLEAVLYPLGYPDIYYKRQYCASSSSSSATWTSWKQFTSTDLFPDPKIEILGVSKVTGLSATSAARFDLQSISTIGVYISPNSSTTQYIDNKPEEVENAFRLTVKQQDFNDDRLTFVLEQLNHPAVFYRMSKLGSTFSNWEKFISLNSINDLLSETVAEYSQKHNNGILTPQMLGFKNDNSLQDSQIFQQAINYAANNNRTLYISGITRLKNTITLPQNFRLVGINGNSSQCAIISTASPIFSIENDATNIVLENLRIDGSGGNALFKGATLEGFHLFNCNCKNFDILFKNCTGHNMVIKNLDATEINSLFSGHFNNSRIEGGYINFKTNNSQGSYLINLTDSSMFTFKNIFFTGSTVSYSMQPEYCFYLSSCFGFVIDNCIIDYFKRGVVLASCQNFTFANNSIRGCGTQDVVSIIYMDTCKNAAFIYNNYLPTHKNTISQRNASSRTLRMINCTSITTDGNKYSQNNTANISTE